MSYVVEVKRFWERVLKWSDGREWLVAFACLAVILLAHSPRLWLLREYLPGTFEWDRAIEYIRQCEAPFRADVSPALRWRFVPQVFVWLLGGKQWLALLFPFLGSAALLSYIYITLRVRGHEQEHAVCLTVALGATSPVLVSTGWLGFNDWLWALGLCYITFGRRPWIMALACVFCCLVDERFMFGLPLSFLIRRLLEPREFCFSDLLPLAGKIALAVTPFLLFRLLGDHARGGSSQDLAFLAGSMRSATSWLWCTPVALWMSLRLLWIPLAQAVFAQAKISRLATLLLVGGGGALVLIGFLLATDTLRTAGILLPVALWSVCTPSQSLDLRMVRILAVGALLIPVVHVTGVKFSPVNSMPLELVRLLRN